MVSPTMNSGMLKCFTDLQTCCQHTVSETLRSLFGISAKIKALWFIVKEVKEVMHSI